MRRAAALAAAALLLLASLAARSAVLRRGPAAQRLVPAAMRSAGAGGAGAAGAGERAALVELQEGAARVFRAPGGSLALSWTEGMRQLASEADTPLQRALLGVLGGQTRAYFWEMPPATARADPRFEFVLTPAPALEGVRADWRAFAEHTEAACKAGSAVATFSNLGGDALLVAPCGPSPPAEERRDGGSLQTYAHAQAFFRGAPLEERRALLREVACQALREVEGGRKEPLWVSTSGAGVSWLHVRLDSAPKYYTFSPYRVMA